MSRNMIGRKIDRSTTCPFHLRIFWQEERFLSLNSFENFKNLPTNEVDTYTWLDCSLIDLCNLVDGKLGGNYRKRNATFSFREIFRNEKGSNTNIMGVVNFSMPRRSDNKTLGDCQFRIGSLVSLEIRFRER